MNLNENSKQNEKKILRNAISIRLRSNDLIQNQSFAKAMGMKPVCLKMSEAMGDRKKL